MSFLKKLFGGGGAAKAAEPVEYEGFAIYAEPIDEGGVFRVAARIEKTVDGETRSAQMVRSDTLNGRDAAIEATINKAKQVINERGNVLFDSPRA